MKTLRILVFCIALWAIAGAVQAQRIAEVVVRGNVNVPQEAILAKISAKPGMDFDQNLLLKDRAALRDMGFFSDVIPRTENTPQGVRIVYEVQEYPRLSEVRVTGNTVFPTDEILKVMRTKPGNLLNHNDLAADIEAITRMYMQKGYLVNVDPETVGLDRENPTILNLPLKEVTVEAVKVSGLRKTRERVVLREMRYIRPGSLYNLEQIQRDLQRVYNTELFEDISYKAELGSDLSKVIITVNVVERRTGLFSVGASYNNRQQLVGFLEMYETNFRGMGQTLGVRLERGGPANTNSYEINFTEPWLDRRNTSLSLSLFDKTLYRFSRGLFTTDPGTIGDEDRYDERRRGGIVTLSRPLSESTRAYVSLRSESVRTNNPAVLPTEVFIKQDGTVSALSLRLTHNTRDVDFDPATGSFDSISFETALADLKDIGTAISGGFVGKGSFNKVSIDLRRYFSPQGRRRALADKRHVFAFRLYAGRAFGKLPFFEQFFLGGAESLRGYPEDRFWGENVALFSVEYRAPLAQNLVGVLFVDAGDAWGGRYGTINDFTQHSNFKPQVGAGIGIRVRTPIGPLRLDYGFGSEGARTHFSIGNVF
ncbi:MAG: BamA/TamA family outer membrane protein [Chthonomonadetes bacterium]|nr:BamA/TamA family outer membrane protein [Chthonomonadetes bacterium]